MQRDLRKVRNYRNVSDYKASNLGVFLDRLSLVKQRPRLRQRKLRFIAVSQVFCNYSFSFKLNVQIQIQNFILSGTPLRLWAKHPIT